MTIIQLAKFIVESYYEGCPGDESYQIALDREIRNLSGTIQHNYNGTATVTIPIEII